MFSKFWSKIKNWKTIVSLLVLLASIVIWCAQILAVNVRVVIEYGESYENDTAQLFFNMGDGYVQENSSIAAITGEKAEFVVNPEFFNCKGIRLDPGAGEAAYKITNIKVYSQAFKNGKILLKDITAGDLEEHAVLLSGNRVESPDGSYAIQDQGKDPSVVFDDMLTGQFAKAVRNNWLIKVVLQCLVCIFYVLFLLWKTKGKHAARTGGIICGILILCVLFVVFVFWGLPDKYYLSATGMSENVALQNTGYKWLIIFCGAFCGSLVGLSVFHRHLRIEKRRIICVIYVLLLAFAGFKMWYYAAHVGQAPDEEAHVAYIAYLEDSGKIIPQFEDMRLLGGRNGIAYQGGERTFTFNSNTNFLGHPPLYYHIMRLSGGVEVGETGEISVNYTKLRAVTIAMVLLALALWFYAGYTWLDKGYPVQHLLYGTIMVCIPMVCYSGAGVNNDTLTFLGGALAVNGMLRFVKEKRDWKTYWGIALGVTAMILGKVTAGAMIVLAIWGYLAWELFTKRRPKEIFKPAFWTTVPLYLLVILYFIIVYRQVGAIQPSYQILDYEGYRQSWAYTAFEQRMVFSLGEYIFYYLSNFLYTWCGWCSSFFGIFSKTKMSEMVFWLVPTLLWLAPLLLFCKGIFAEKNEKRFMQMICASILAVFLLQFKSAYGGFFFRSGYLGGLQSRYYLCLLGIFAYIWTKFNVAVSERGEKARIIVRRVSVGAAIVLMCGDFIYFLIKFADFYC
ncbi:MAG: glycosyltransferase family 39 protein [Lachnospiraceae bacterium]|nr:glycosyltransferase family 39 protein [Lachnospiraceae bacterium]